MVDKTNITESCEPHKLIARQLDCKILMTGSHQLSDGMTCRAALYLPAGGFCDISRENDKSSSTSAAR